MIQATTRHLHPRPVPVGATGRIADCMEREPAIVCPDTITSHADRILRGLGVHHLLVLDESNVLGVLCRCDLWSADSTTPVEEQMTSPAATIEPGARLEEGVQAMRDLAVGCLPVVAGERLVGIITRRTLRRAGAWGRGEVVRTCAACRTHVRLGGRLAERPVVFCGVCRLRGYRNEGEEE